MTRPPLSLSHHLLTRSDLAKLGIQAGRILTWLANGWLDQVGSLPNLEAPGDPVFAVLTRELRDELAARLQELGKDTVVFSPLRVRSLLVRAMLLGGNSPALSQTATVSQPIEETPPVPDPVAEALLDTNVTGVLRLAAQDLEHEVEQVLQLAREEARLEALELATASDPEVVPPSPGNVDEESETYPANDDPIREYEEQEQGDFFDTDDLVEEFGAWAPDAVVEAPPVAEPPVPMPPALATADLEVAPDSPLSSAGADATETAAGAPQDPPAELVELDAADQADEDVLPDEPATRESQIMPELKLDEVPVADATATSADDHHPMTDTEEPADESSLEDIPSADQPAPLAPELALAPDPRPDDAMFFESATAASAPAIGASPATLATEPSPEQTVAVEPLPSPAAETSSALAMQRVESFLGELRHVLVEMANRPQQPALDVQPLVAAVQQGFVHSNQQAKATDTALASLTDRLGEFGDKVEHGVALAVHAALGAKTGDSVARNAMPVAAPTFVIARPDRSAMALFAVGFLLLCWTVIFWFKTGNTKLALTTLIATNVVGCCLFVGKNRGA